MDDDARTGRDHEWWLALCGNPEVPPIPAMVKRWLFERILQAISGRAERERLLLEGAKEHIAKLEAAIRPLLTKSPHSWDGVKSVALYADCECRWCVARRLLPENRPQTPEKERDPARDVAAVLRGE